MKLLKFYLFSFFEGFVPVYPVYLIMFTERGFSLMDVSILMMFWALPVVILELPTGFLADLWSKKKMMVIGMVLKALGFFLWLVSGSFLFAVLGFFCWAVQESFCSGSRQALLYEAVTHENVSISYEKAAGICSMIEMAGIAFAMITGGILYAYSPTLTLLASSAAALISAFIGLSLKEYKNEEAPEEGFKDFFKSIFTLIKTKPALLTILAASGLAGGAYGLVDEYDGLWAHDNYGVPLVFIGVWSAIRFGVQGLGSFFAERFSFDSADDKKKKKTVPLLVLAGLVFASTVFLPPVIGIPLYFLWYGLMALFSVVLEAELQRLVTSDVRSTMLSLSSFIVTLSAFVLAPLFGLVSERFGLGGIIVLTGAVSLLGAVPFIVTLPARPHYKPLP